MFGITSDFPWHLLAGTTLIQVCIGENEVNLHFDQDVALLIMSSFRIDKGEVCDNYRNAATPLCQFLGKTLINVHPNGKTCLALDFGDGSLELYDDDEHYESFVVTVGELRLVV